MISLSRGGIRVHATFALVATAFWLLGLRGLKADVGVGVTESEAEGIHGGQVPCNGYFNNIACTGSQGDTCTGTSGVCYGGGSLLSCSYSCTTPITSRDPGGSNYFTGTSVVACPTTTKTRCGAPPTGPCGCVGPVDPAGCGQRNSAANFQPCTPVSSSPVSSVTQ